MKKSELPYGAPAFDRIREEDWLPAAMGLREASEHLAGILGRKWDEDTLDAVFSRFCVGK